jgi:hypothetical protein
MRRVAFVLVGLGLGLASCRRDEPTGRVASEPSELCRAPRRVPDGAAAAPRPLPWPALPRTRVGAELLIHARSERAAKTEPKLDPAALLSLLEDPSTRWVAGEPAVRRWLVERLGRARLEGRDAFLLWGTFHDSRLQVDAFRRLIGPGGLPDLDAVVVEQFDADGRWEGLPRSAQAGDGCLLRGFLERGETAAWDALAARQTREDYTAWKYGYLSSVMDLLTAARAAGTPLLGCDMPRTLQSLAAGLGSELYRLRELHCLLALEAELGARTRGRRIAMLWGQDHVKPHGIRRFLRKEGLVLSAFLLGGRPGSLTPEAGLARRLAINDPVLVPLDGSEEQIALLLPGRDLGGEVDRARDWLEAPAASQEQALLRVRSTARGLLRVGDRTLSVGPRERSLTLPAGEHRYLLSAGQRRIVGAIELAGGGGATLRFEPEQRRTVVVYQAAGLNASPR